MGLGEYDPYDPATVGTAARRTSLINSNDYNNASPGGENAAPRGGEGGGGGLSGGGLSRDDEVSASAKAAHVIDQMHSLRAIIDRAMGGVSAPAGTSVAFRLLEQSVEGLENWWDVKQREDLISYQEADVYIKRAAAGLAGHRKWYASHNKRASKTITEALEELRLASLVLQQKHGEEEDAAKALSAASRELTGSVRAEQAAMLQLRAQLEPAVSAITDSMEAGVARRPFISIHFISIHFIVFRCVTFASNEGGFPTEWCTRICFYYNSDGLAAVT